MGSINSEMHIVVFKLGREEYCIPVNQVQEIQDYNRDNPPRRMPNSSHFIEGIINLRGQIIPVLDLKKRFNLGKIEPTRETRFIVVEIDKEKIGILVDAVLEVLRINADTFEPPPSKITASINTAYISGVGRLHPKDKEIKEEKLEESERLVILLDIDKILNEDEMDELKEVVEDDVGHL